MIHIIPRVRSSLSWRFVAFEQNTALNQGAIYVIIFEVQHLCGCSSVVRALPCQGRGRELESLHPHQIEIIDEKMLMIRHLFVLASEFNLFHS